MFSHIQRHWGPFQSSSIEDGFSSFKQLGRTDGSRVHLSINRSRLCRKRDSCARLSSATLRDCAGARDVFARSRSYKEIFRLRCKSRTPEHIADWSSSSCRCASGAMRRTRSTSSDQIFSIAGSRLTSLGNAPETLASNHSTSGSSVLSSQSSIRVHTDGSGADACSSSKALRLAPERSGSHGRQSSSALLYRSQIGAETPSLNSFDTVLSLRSSEFASRNSRCKLANVRRTAQTRAFTACARAHRFAVGYSSARAPTTMNMALHAKAKRRSGDKPCMLSLSANCARLLTSWLSPPRGAPDPFET